MDTKLGTVPIIQLTKIKIVTASELYGVVGSREIRTEIPCFKLTLKQALAALSCIPQSTAIIAQENPGPSHSPNTANTKSCEGTANLGEGKQEMDPFKDTKIFFIVSPQDSEERVYQDIREYGLLEYIFIAKEQTENRRFIRAV